MVGGGRGFRAEARSQGGPGRGQGARGVRGGFG